MYINMKMRDSYKKTKTHRFNMEILDRVYGGTLGKKLME